ncbi:MAG: hypothetical protein ACWA45_00965, partial [Flavobacteriales bacterium]
NFFVKKILKNFFSEEFISKLRWKLIHLNTKEKKSNYLLKINEDFKKELSLFFKEDIEKLEIFLKKDLSHWKN